MGDAPVGALAAPNARQLRDLGLHQLAHDHADRVAQQVSVLAHAFATMSAGSS